MRITIDELDHLVKQVLQTEYTDEEADMIKEAVMFGELSGRQSHGIMRLLPDSFGAFVDVTPTKKPEFIHKTKVSTLVEGNGNSGMLVGTLALKEVIRLAKESSIGIVGTKGSFNTTGSLSYYVEKIANEGLIGVVLTQCSPMVSAFGSKTAVFGTNPMAFGIPSKDNPVIFDMSTAAITYGTIKQAQTKGNNLPENVAIDKDGNITTDPAKALDGASLVFDNSYKGGGLAMMIEMFAAMWTGASFMGQHEEDGWGNLYLACSPELLCDKDVLFERTSEFVNFLKSQKTVDQKSIRIPGENTLKNRDAALRSGEIEVSQDIITKLKKLLLD